MSKRRLSERQSKRIQAAQDAHSNSNEHRQGIVVSHQGGQVLVESETGINLECKIKSNLGSIVCGDRVAIESSNQGHRIMAILSRENLYSALMVLARLGQ